MHIAHCQQFSAAPDRSSASESPIHPHLGPAVTPRLHHHSSVPSASRLGKIQAQKHSSTAPAASTHLSPVTHPGHSIMPSASAASSKYFMLCLGFSAISAASAASLRYLAAVA